MIRKAVNALLIRRGYMVMRVIQPKTSRQPARAQAHRKPTERLLTRPAFILCPVRSGSTLLRLLLDSHSEIHSPHEMHLKAIDVTVTGRYGQKALEEGRLERQEMRNVLWDWYLDRQLGTTGKRLLVNKTPNDVFITDAIRDCWPDARFVFLLRHPLAVLRSRAEVRPQDSHAINVAKVLEYAEAVERARTTLPGHTIRYEDLTTDPVSELTKLCAYLGVEFEPSMLDYGTQSSSTIRMGLGDWMESIRTGMILPPRPLPATDEVPEALRPYAAAWGYLPADSGPLEPELERAKG